jgi:predicted ester cyclase
VGTEDNKKLVQRLVEEVVRGQNLDVLDDVADQDVARAAKGWVGPFRRAFPDFDMEIVDLIAEGDKVVAHFKCSGTHQGEWHGVAPTGKRFEGVDEIYIFRIVGGKLASAVAVEDNLTRMRQLGFEL